MIKNVEKYTLEFLENDYWKTPDYDSKLVKTCHLLRKKKIEEFTIEDLRIMIGQNIGLPYLLPIALNQLKNNILSEGDYYPGDLLSSVLTSEINYWKSNIEKWVKLNELIEGQKNLIIETDLALWKKYKIRKEELE